VKHFIVGTAATAVAFFILVKLVPGYVEYSGELIGLVGLALIFGVVNGLIKPIVKLLALPVRVMTLGLIGFVINGAMLLLTAWLASLLDIDFTVGGWPADSFGLDVIVAAIVGAIVLTVILAISDKVVPD
jgi:putative membrane protein